jgi:hypothetical protein
MGSVTMPLTLTQIAHDSLCHGSRWIITDENDLASKVAYLALGQARHISIILAGIDKKPPSTRPDTAKEAIKLSPCPLERILIIETVGFFRRFLGLRLIEQIKEILFVRHMLSWRIKGLMVCNFN